MSNCCFKRQFEELLEAVRMHQEWMTQAGHIGNLEPVDRALYETAARLRLEFRQADRV